MTDSAAIVASYVGDAWWRPETRDGAVPVRDASTDEVVALVSASGLDLADVLDHGRRAGQASLGALTFHQRALLLKQLAQVLTERKGELYELSARAGATLADSRVDVDGGIGVLFTYSSKGRRELPNTQVYLDGPAESLSRDGSFLGRHIYTRLSGVAVQVNAFNFPVWGMLEKFAPAFLAGVPTVAKPATPTAYIAEACVRIMVESGLLPDGSLQFVAGRVPGLLDALRWGDLLAFTGSASTADTFRAHPSVGSGGVRFTAETDSLNASVLGVGAGPGSPEFDAYVKQVVTEMTAKAGQKCTAIRRIIVPRGAADSVTAAISERLDARVVVGDPRAEGVTMGPLVSLEQRQEVLGQLERLVAAGGRIVYGSTGEPSVARVSGADGADGVDAVAGAGRSGVAEARGGAGVAEVRGGADAAEVRGGAGAAEVRGGAGAGTAGSAPGRAAGAFLGPVLLRFDDPWAEAAHTVEAFGPVASVLCYDTLDEAIDLVRRGGGSLVTSISSHDPEETRAFVTAIASANGRVLVLDRDDARSSTGHGSPVPHLVHGGPGRAGGGEELGGIRAVLHHMQRTAVQGSPDALTAITGVWHAGARADAGGTHPFRKPLTELRVGDRVSSGSRIVSLEDIEHFAEFTGDTFYAHTDEEAARANPFFPGRVAHGYLLVSFAAGLFVDPAPGPVLANYGLENLRFLTPVSPGDSIRVDLTAKQITPRETDDYGEVRWDAVLTNQRDETVATYDVLTLVAKG